MKLVIYSKPNCIQCDKVKMQCDEMGIDYVTYDATLDQNFIKDKLKPNIPPNHRMFPVLFVFNVGIDEYTEPSKGKYVDSLETYMRVYNP